MLVGRDPRSRRVPSQKGVEVVEVSVTPDLIVNGPSREVGLRYEVVFSVARLIHLTSLFEELLHTRRRPCSLCHLLEFRTVFGAARCR
jgi:hypothetical protein